MASTVTMNAQTIILKVNEMLKHMLEDYYDTIVNDVVAIIDKEIPDNLTTDSNINYLKKCISDSGLKEKIFNVDSEENVPVKITPEVTHSIPSETMIRALKRKDIQAMCKIHGIPGRQKNEELIQQLLTKRQTQITEGKQPIPEPEPEPIVEKDETPDIITKKVKKIKITKTTKKKQEHVEKKEEEFVPEVVVEEEDDEMSIANMFQLKCGMNDDDEEIEEIEAEIKNQDVPKDEENVREIPMITDELDEEEDDEEKDLAAAYDSQWDDKFFESDTEEDDENNAALDAEDYDDE